MGLHDVIGSIVSFLVRLLLRIGETVLALGTLAGYVLLWLTLRQPDVTLTSRVMQVLYLATAAVSVLLATLVLVEAYLGVSGAFGGFLPGLPSRSSSGGSSGGSTLSAPSIGDGDSGSGDADGGGSRFGVGDDDDDGGGGGGSILGPHN